MFLRIYEHCGGVRIDWIVKTFEDEVKVAIQRGLMHTLGRSCAH